MAYDNIVKPRQTFAHGAVQYELDVRHVPEIGADLKKVILASVDHTQSVIMMELPSFLVVTKKQYVSLLDYTQQMYESTERMFRTPLNVMEVLVDNENEHVDPDQRDSSPIFEMGDVLQHLN
jgi:hypothetical protein